MEIINIAIEKLKPTEYNPRLDLKPEDKEYQDIKRSIVEFGLVEPLVVNGMRGREGIIIGGHQRLKVLKELNFTTIPCIIVNLDKQKEKMCNIALNKISGDWERGKLKDILLELDTGEFDVSLTGWGEQEIEDLMTEFHIEPEEDDFDVDKAIEAVGEPICERGDIWQLGNHFLMCGDAIIEEDVKRLMDGKKADMVFTDPPYGVDYKNNKRVNGHEYKREQSYEDIENDKLEPEKYYQFILSVINNIALILNECAVVYICTADKPPFRQSIEQSFLKNDLKYSSYLIWNKGNFGFGFQNYRPKHEGILYYKKGLAETLWIGGQDKSTIIEIAKDPNKEYQHPTQKPVELVGFIINNHKVSIIVDLFGGSGSTLIACEQLNRKCYMMEISELYCDVIINRWEQYVNKKAVKLNEER